MLNQDKQNYQAEETQLLKTILNYRFFNPWSYDLCDQYSLKNDANLEIYITNVCNQHCSYCYLTQFPDLYPSDCLDQELLLHNLQLLYDWILEKDYSIPKVEFFSGEIWHTEFGWKILDLTLQYLHKGLKFNMFLIASNFSFIFDDIARNKINYYIRAFKNCGHDLIFSCSCDGAIIEQESRPTNNGQIRDEKYWQTLFEFCKVHKFWFHPMISAKNVHAWIENYDWWESQCKKYNFHMKQCVNMLEVRNNDWDQQAIQSYINFLHYIITKYFDECNHDVATYTHRILHLRDSSERIDPELYESGYSPMNIGEVDSFLGCTIATDLTIRLGDLAICPCHRTAYNKYLYGKLVVQDDKIVDIDAINVNMAVKVLMSNLHTCYHGCDTCMFSLCCLRGCLGSQIENTGDPFFPNTTVCDFFKAKYAFLLSTYEQMGIIDYLRSFTPYEKDYDDANLIIKVYDQWVKEGKPYVMAPTR